MKQNETDSEDVRYEKLLGQLIREDGLEGCVLFTMKREGDKAVLAFQREAAKGHEMQIAAIDHLFRTAVMTNYQQYLEERIKGGGVK